MSAFAHAPRAARIILGLLPLSITHAALLNDAVAGVNVARPPMVSGASPVSTIPPAFEPPARYFSINRVLAEHDRQLANAASPRRTSFEGNTDIIEQAPAAAEVDEPFGLPAFRAPEGLLWAKWRGVEAAIDEDAGTLAQCRNDTEHCTSSAALRFLAMIEQAQRASGRERIDAVNRMVNAAILYTSDLVQHGVADLWSAPLATLSSGRGDCEDYAIAKYVLLRESGVAAGDLRLLLVRDTLVRQDHAVLAVRQAHHWLILDNRWSISADSSEVRNLMPLFAIDQQGVRQFGPPYEVQAPHEGLTGLAPAASGNSAAGGSQGVPAPIL